MQRFVRRWSFVFVFVFLLQPLCPPLAHAGRALQARRAALLVTAQRLGLDPLLLSDPSAYLAREDARREQQRTQAALAVARASQPDPVTLAALESTASAIKQAHAPSAVYGSLTALALVAQQLDTALAHGELRTPTALAGLRPLLEQTSADLDRLAATPAGAAPLAAERTATFVGAQREYVQAVLAVLDQQPDQSAPAAVHSAWLQQLQIALHGPAGSAASPALPGLPNAPTRSLAQAPHASALAFALADVSAASARLGRLPQTLAALTALSAPPTPADLAETIDVRFTASVQALVAQANGDPLALFNLVHDTFDSELYYGSKKGTQGTLDARAGNATDLSSLLIALLRAANIPARYAIGTVWLTGQQAQDLTRTTSTAAAADALATAGIPATYVIRSSGEPVVAIEHTWVQAWLPYEQYRGILEAQGASSWIDLDPWVKRFSFSTPVDLRQAVTFNALQYLQTLSTTTPLEQWLDQLRTYIRANQIICTTFAAATRVRTIVPDQRALLPARLPLRQFTLLAAPSEVSAAQRYALTIELLDGQNQAELSLERSLPEVYGQRIDLTFPAAAAADQALIDQYGDLFATPPYLVYLRPTLSISETAVATSAPLHPGVARTLRVAFYTPGLTSPVPEIAAETYAGEIRVVGLDYQTIPQALIDQATARQAALPAESPSAEAQRLYTMLLTYFKAVDRTWQTVTDIEQHTYVRDLGAGFGVRQVRVRSSFGAPVGVSAGAPLIDVPKLTWTPFDSSASQAHILPLTTLTGYQSSALEHQVVQQFFGMDAVSAVKSLQLASSGGQSMLTVTSAAQVPALQVPQAVKDTILDALNRGWHAVVSPSPITRYQWQGVGYIIFDPVSGSGAYLIANRANGGEGTGGGDGNNGSCGTGQGNACPSALDVLGWIVGALSGGAGGGGGNNGGGNLLRTGALGDAAASLASAGPAINPPSGYQNEVNLSNGNLLLQTGDLVVSSVGLPVGMARSYNSLLPYSGRFGPHWIDTFDERLIVANDGSVSYLDASGALYRFTPSGSDFSAPPGFFGTLAAAGGGYTLTTKEGITSTFAADGRLLQQQDRNQNTLTLNYNGSNQLISVTDASNRTALTFSYTNNRLTSITDLAGRSVQYTYTPSGALASVTDVDGHTTSYAYDDQHRIITLTNAKQQTTRYVYDDHGRVIRVIDPLGNVRSLAFDSYNGRTVVTGGRDNDTVYAIDPEGRPASITDALGNATSYQRDADHNVVALTTPTGNTTSMTYDDQGNMLSKTPPGGYPVAYTYADFGQVQTVTVDGTQVQANTYDAAGNLLTTTNAANQTASYTYDAQGRLQTSVDERGTESTYSYGASGIIESSTVAVANPVTGQTRTETTALHTDAVGRMIDMEDANGVQTTIATDGLGRFTTLSLPAAPATQLAYDPLGNPLLLSSAGLTQTLGYNGASQLTTITDTLNNVSRMDYDADGNQTRMIDPLGSIFSTEYDALGRQIRQIDPLGMITHYQQCATFDAVCAVVDGNGNTMKTQYDAFGRPTEVSDALGHTMRWQYDSAGRVIAATDAAGRTTRYAYDALDNLIAVTDALSHTTSFTYLPGTIGAGRDGGFPSGLTSLTDANNHTWTYDYDSQGRLVRETDPNSKATIYTYDPAGRMTARADANGALISYSYDSAGRLLGTTGALTATYSYDSTGRRTAMSNADAGYSYTHDAMGRLASLTDTTLNKTVALTYNARGQRATLVDPENGVTSYGYDAAGRLTRITDPQGGVTSYTYDAGGRRTQVRYPNGVTTTSTYDAANRLTALITHDAAGAVLSAYSYGYDAVGNRTSVTDANGLVTSYTYDALDRLTQVSTGSSVTSFTYDAVGNRQSMTVNGRTTAYTYDDANRLLTSTLDAATTTYAYDDNGNLISQAAPGGTTLYTYDAANRLLTLDVGGSVQRFAYAPTGERVSATASGSTTRFLVLQNQVLADYTPAGERSARYVHGRSLDEIVSITRASGTQYLHYDGLGSATRTTDADGAVIGTQEYDAFGVITRSQGWSTRYGYTGREHLPQTDLLYYRSRYYDSSAGRFLSVDSVRGNVLLPPSLHRYTYVHNNPVNYIDPMGNIAFTPYLVVFLAGVAVFFTGFVMAGVGVARWQSHDPAVSADQKWAGFVYALSGLSVSAIGLLLSIASVAMAPPLRVFTRYAWKIKTALWAFATAVLTATADQMSGLGASLDRHGAPAWLSEIFYAVGNAPKFILFIITAALTLSLAIYNVNNP